MMNRSKKPPLIAHTTSLIASNYGIKLLYFTPWDINFKQNKVSGKVYINNKQTNILEDIPPLIDIQSRCFKKDTRPIVEKLREQAIFTFDRKNTPSKLKLQRELQKDSYLKRFVIPTQCLKTFDELISFINIYKRVVIKPIRDQQGQSVYKIEEVDNDYLLAFNSVTKKLSKKDLLLFYNEKLQSTKYKMQKYINSRTNNNDPFDCRVIVQKNRHGKWEIAQILIRTGIGQKVVSNTSKGGGISYPKQFLNITLKINGKKFTKI